MIYYIFFISLFFVRSNCQEGSCSPSDPRCIKKVRSMPIPSRHPKPNLRSTCLKTKEEEHLIDDDNYPIINILDDPQYMPMNRIVNELPPAIDPRLQSLDSKYGNGRWSGTKNRLSESFIPSRKPVPKSKIRGWHPLILKPKVETNIVDINQLEQLQKQLNDLINNKRNYITDLKDRQLSDY